MVLLDNLTEENSDIHDELIDSWSDEVVDEGEWGGCPWLEVYAPLVLERSFPYQGLQNKSLSTFYIRESTIRENAYFQWEAAGCPEGTGEDFWLNAEQKYDSRVQEEDKTGEWDYVNSWYSKSRHAEISIWRHKDTKQLKVFVQAMNWFNRMRFILNTYQVAEMLPV